MSLTHGTIWSTPVFGFENHKHVIDDIGLALIQKMSDGTYVFSGLTPNKSGQIFITDAWVELAMKEGVINQHGDSQDFTIAHFYLRFIEHDDLSMRSWYKVETRK